jgi:hypothetical protein
MLNKILPKLMLLNNNLHKDNTENSNLNKSLKVLYQSSKFSVFSISYATELKKTHILHTKKTISQNYSIHKKISMASTLKSKNNKYKPNICTKKSTN